MPKPDDKKGIKINPAKDYEKMIQLQLKYLPKQVQAELAARGEYDPQFIEQALGLQHTYDPRLAQEQREAVMRRDPEWVRTHGLLGDKVQAALERGYLDPRQEAAYAKMAALAGRGEPTRDRAYQALGEQVTGDTLRGGTADPETLRQMTQAIMSRSPNLSYGEAQDMANAVYVGQRSQNLKQQRQQATGQFLQTATPTAQRELSLSNFYGQQSPLLGAMGAAGTYLSGPTMSQMISGVSGVSPPRAFGYVNPQAGMQGLQLGLQNQQAQLANQALSGGGGNPWTNALQGAAQGANYGSVGGGYGAAGGAITGGILGAFGYPQYSDARLKKNISRTGLSTPDGIPIVDYDFQGRRWRGVLAQDVQRVRPDAVYSFGNGRLGVFYSRIGVEVQELQQNDSNTQEDV